MFRLNAPRAGRRAAAWVVGLFCLGVAGCQAPDTAAGRLSPEARMRLAEAFDRSQGGHAASLTLLQEEAARRPEDAGLQQRLAILAERAGRDAEAAEALRRVVALRGPTLPVLLATGRLALRAGEAAAAIDAFSRAHDLAPRDPAPLAGLGVAHDMAQDPARAADAYRRGLALAPGDWTLRGNLALSLLLSGRAGEAVPLLADAEYAPGAPRQARHNLALALAFEGRQRQVVRVLRSDMGPAEAEAMAQEFAAIARWAQPEAAALPPAPRGPVGRRNMR